MVLLLLCSMLSHPMSMEVSVSLTPKQYLPVSSAISSKYLRPPPDRQLSAPRSPSAGRPICLAYAPSPSRARHEGELSLFVSLDKDQGQGPRPRKRTLR